MTIEDEITQYQETINESNIQIKALKIAKEKRDDPYWLLKKHFKNKYKHPSQYSEGPNHSIMVDFTVPKDEEDPMVGSDSLEGLIDIGYIVQAVALQENHTKIRFWLHSYP